MSRKEQIKEFFTFTKGEKRGIIVLIILVILVILVNQFSYLFIKESKTDFSEFRKEIADFEKSLTPIQENYSDNSYLDKKYDTLQLFTFNPNTVSDKDWKLLGIAERQIKTINNWKNKGGSFKYKNDLKRIYGISEEQYQKLKNYIDLPEKKLYSEESNYKTSDNKASEYKIPDVKKYFEFNPNETSELDWKLLGFSQKQISTIKNYLNKGGKFYKKEDLKKIYGIKEFQYNRIEDYIKLSEKKDNIENQTNVKVDLNNLSEEEFKELGGFWKYNAVRIVKYRNLLGGYYKKEQLLEVYGMKREYYLKVADDIIIDKSTIEKIHLNFAEVSELGRHQYITYKEAEQILDYRNKHGAYKKLEDLFEKEVISKSLYDKISPYLKVK